MGAVLHCDFETRSTVDLKKAGLDNYARHPTTDVWCMAYAFGDGSVGIWHPRTECFAHSPLEHVRKGGTVAAHNAQFELAIWNHVMVPRYGWPVLRAEQCRDTMVMAYAMSLPGALENAAAAVGIKQQKDMAGNRLMLQMCRPREVKPDDWTGRKCSVCEGVGEKFDPVWDVDKACRACAGTGGEYGPIIVWWDEPDKLERLYAYCKNDVEVERALDKRLMQLSDSEHRLWVLDQKINNRGVYIDQKAVRAAIAIAENEQRRLNAKMREVTSGFVSKATELPRLKKWMVTQGIVDAETDGLAKADVLEYLEDPATPAAVCEALKVRQEAGKTSTSKLQPMLDVASTHDGTLKYMFQFNAAGTGRWGGRKVQLHNLVRPKLKAHEVEDAIQKICALPPEKAAQYLSVFHGPPMDVLSWCLRGMLHAAPGKDLLVADYSNIEGRALAWLAGEEWKLEAFRVNDEGRGPDLYLVAAGRIYGKPPTAYTKDSEERQHGKVAELACGYGGGVGAFQTMAKTYLVKIADDLADDIKKKWRVAHPRTVQYWADLETAAMDAVLHGGTRTVGPKGREVSYRKAGSFLWCKLPGGRVLCYPYPKIMPVLAPWGDWKDSLTYMCVVDEQQRKKGKIIEDPAAHGDWQRVSTYGGKLSENVTQAVCRDLLAAGMWNVENAGYPVVLHVHDEIGSEVPKGFGDLKEFERLCSTMPAWAQGLPVVAKGWRGERYRKE